MEKIKLSAPDVFMTFGLGALLILSLVASLSGFLKMFGLEQVTASVFAIAEFWVPITVSLVFALHAIGLLVVLLGSYPLSKLSGTHKDAEEAYHALVDSASDRLWAIVTENRKSKQFAYGLAGICTVHLIVALVDFLRWIPNVDNYLSYDYFFLPIFFCSLLPLIYHARSLDLKLIKLDLAQQALGLQSRLRSVSETNE